MGPTASGKTEVAEAIADALGAQLVNADAFQVYRGMDIGTAKPREKSRYQLLDLKDPKDQYGVGEFVQRARALLFDLFTRGRSAVVVGGTGLYIRALFEGYADLAEGPDPRTRALLMARETLEGSSALAVELAARAPDVAARIDLRNPVRVRRALERVLAPTPPIAADLPPFLRTKFAIQRDRDELGRLIELRVHSMVQNGWLEEVESLKLAGFGPPDPGFRALGYAALWQHLAGTRTLNDALEATVLETRRYAKRQRSWLRSEPNAVPIGGATAAETIAIALGALRS